MPWQNWSVAEAVYEEKYLRWTPGPTGGADEAVVRANTGKGFLSGRCKAVQ